MLVHVHVRGYIFCYSYFCKSQASLKELKIKIVLLFDRAACGVRTLAGITGAMATLAVIGEFRIKCYSPPMASDA